MFSFNSVIFRVPYTQEFLNLSISSKVYIRHLDL